MVSIFTYLLNWIQALLRMIASCSNITYMIIKDCCVGLLYHCGWKHLLNLLIPPLPTLHYVWYFDLWNICFFFRKLGEGVFISGRGFDGLDPTLYIKELFSLLIYFMNWYSKILLQYCFKSINYELNAKLIRFYVKINSYLFKILIIEPEWINLIFILWCLSSYIFYKNNFIRKRGWFLLKI